MKIKDVCIQTGLTDRTIRFYIEKGLLQTKSQTINGRISREYTEEDVSILMDIAKLRKAGFSIQDILDMQNTENDINRIIAEHCEKLEVEQCFRNNIIQELKEINKRGKMPWRKLASILFQEKQYKNDAPLHFPEETDLIKELPKKKWDQYLRRGIFIAVILLLLSGAITIVLRERRNRQPLLATFIVTEVVFEEKWREGNTFYVTLQATHPEGSFLADEYFAEPRTLTIESDTLYSSLQIQSEPYSSVNGVIQIPYGEAKELDLVGEDGFLIFDKLGEIILSDISLIQKYCTIISVEAGGETQIYTYP